MKIYSTFLCLLLLYYFQANALSCTKQDDDQLNILSQENEIIRYSLKQLFLNPQLDYLNFQEQNTKFTILPQIRHLNQNTYPEQKILQSIIDVKSKLAANTHYPLNQYVILNRIAPDYTLYYSLPSQGKQIVDIQYQASRNNNQEPLNCFGTDYIDNINVVVDCAKPEVIGNPLENIMIVYTNIKENEYVEYPNPNNGNYESITRRIIYAQQNQNRNIIIRGTPYNGIKQDESSIIEILEIVNNQILTIILIDEDQLKQISDIQKFQLIDFKSNGSNTIAILNSNGYIFVIVFDINNQSFKLIKQISINSTKLLNFDYQFDKNTHVAISKTTLYSSYYSYTFQQELNNPQVYFAQEYILILDGKQIYQFQFYSELLYKTILNDQGYLISSQVRNEFIIFSKSKIDKYTLHSDSQLQYQSKSQQEIKSIKLKQQNPGEPECVLEIFYQTIQLGSTDIIVLKDPQEFINQGIKSSGNSEFYQNINYQSIFNGPEIVYQNIHSDELNLKFDYLFTKDFININRTNSKIVYSAVYQRNGFFVVCLQDDDFYIETYICQYDEEIDIYCRQESVISVRYQLTDQTAVYTCQSGQEMLYIINQDGLSLKQIDFQGFVTTEDFGNLTIGKYDQITQTQEYLVALNIYSKTLTIFSLYDYKTYFQINEQKMNDLGLDNFEPTHINIQTYINSILVSSNDMIYVINIDGINQFNVVGQIQLEQRILAERQLAFLQSYIVICDRLQDMNILLSVYPFDNVEISSLYLQKQIFYYSNNYDEDWKLGINYYQNIIYIQGRKGFQSTLTLYKISEISQNVPYYSIKIIENGCLAINQDQIFIFSEYDSKQYYFNTNPQPRIKINRQLSKYVTHTSTNIKLDNPYNNYSYEQQLILLNINSKFVMDSTQVDPNMLRLNKNNNQLVCFDQKKWITGQIISTSILCEECISGEITLTQQIIKQDQLTDMSIDKSSAVLDFNYYKFISLQKTAFTIYDKDDFTNSFTIGLDPLSNCYSITQPKDTIILLGCTTNEGINQIINYQCLGRLCKMGQILTIDYQATGGIIYINNYLFVASSQYLIIYYLEYGIEYLDQAKKIKTSQVDILQIQVSNTIQDIYFIYLLTQQNSLNIQIYTLINGESESEVTEQINLTEFIESQELYIGKNSKINGIWSIDGKNKFLFTITDVAQYAFSFTYNCENNKCTLSKTNLEFILSPYGDWVLNSIPIVSVTNKYVALNYKNDFLGNRIVVYQIDQPVPDTQIPITILGGIQDDPFSSENLQILIYEKDGKDYIIATMSVFKQFQLYEIHGSLDLCFENVENNQRLNLSVKNDFTTENKLLDITITTSTKISNHIWIWIILGLVIVGAIGGGAYYFYQKKNKNNNNKTYNDQNAQLIV